MRMYAQRDKALIYSVFNALRNRFYDKMMEKALSGMNHYQFKMVILVSKTTEWRILQRQIALVWSLGLWQVQIRVKKLYRQETEQSKLSFTLVEHIYVTRVVCYFELFR